jgi:hypothetical protein
VGVWGRGNVFYVQKQVTDDSLIGNLHSLWNVDALDTFVCHEMHVSFIMSNQLYKVVVFARILQHIPENAATPNQTSRRIIPMTHISSAQSNKRNTHSTISPPAMTRTRS